MKLSEILAEKGTQIYSAQAGDPVLSAVETLVTHNVGALAVLDTEGELCGIFSERDILRLVSKTAGELRDLKVGAFMTREVITGTPDDDLEDSLARMTMKHIRHLPVVQRGRLLGMISIGDLVKARLIETEFLNQQMENLVLGRYPA